MNKFFKTISGKPKSGSISECLSPFMTIIQMAFVGYLLGSASSKYGGDYLLSGFLFIIVTIELWQIGWSMSSNRFVLHEKVLKEKQNGTVKEIIKPYIFVTQLVLCVIIDLIGQYCTIDIIKYIMFFISMFLAWQCGWGMDIVRVNSAGDEITNNNKEI